MNFGMAEAVRQKDEELAEVKGCMVGAAYRSWHDPGLIQKQAESEGRDWLHEKDEAEIKHYAIEKEYRTEKHNVIKARLHAQIWSWLTKNKKKEMKASWKLVQEITQRTRS